MCSNGVLVTSFVKPDTSVDSLPPPWRQCVESDCDHRVFFMRVPLRGAKPIDNPESCLDDEEVGVSVLELRLFVQFSLPDWTSEDRRTTLTRHD